MPDATPAPERAPSEERVKRGAANAESLMQWAAEREVPLAEILVYVASAMGMVKDEWSAARDTLAAERDALRAELDAATATFEDEEAAHADTLRLLTEAQVRLGEECETSNHLLTSSAEHKERADKAESLVDALRAERDEARQAKDGAYFERNQLVAALTKIFPAGVGRTAIEGWSEDWHGCVYIDLPTGQVSWHFHDSHAPLFNHLSAYQDQWDGHTTDEKYWRLGRLTKNDARERADRAEAARERMRAALEQISTRVDETGDYVDPVSARLAREAIASPASPAGSGLSERERAEIQESMDDAYCGAGVPPKPDSPASPAATAPPLLKEPAIDPGRGVLCRIVGPVKIEGQS